MKKHVIKAMEKVAEKKQMTFEVDEPKEKIIRTKDIPKRPKSTYWICVNKHVFEYKHQTTPKLIESMRCPICHGRIQNKSTKSTYLYYLKKTGRVDLKEYRQDKIRKENQRLRKEEKMKREFQNNA